MASIATISAIPLTKFNSANLTTSYQAVNLGGIPQNCFYLSINNGSTVSTKVSYDGVHDHLWIASGQIIQLNPPLDAGPLHKYTIFAEGLTVYIKEDGGGVGTGSIYLSGLYIQLS